VIGVTDDTPEKAEPWMKRHGAEYAYAYDKSGLARALGIDTIPRAVLVDVYGNVLYNGHPAKLDEALIEKAVKGAFARPMWEWPEQTQGVREALQRGALGVAVEQAGKLSAEHSGPALRATIEGFVENKLARMRAARESGNYLAAVEAAERLTSELEGLPGAAEARSLVELVRQDSEAQEILRAQRQVELEKLRADHGGTYVEGEARELIEGFKRMLERR
jgi:hypothetical protein